jgi:adenine deaminase
MDINEKRADIIAAAHGEMPVDLLLRNSRLVNVLSGEIQETDVAIHDGFVVGFGAYEAREVVDLHGQYLCPGFMDAHVHIESSMVTVPEFARAVLPSGVTTVITDPHEMANVHGLEGVRYILQTSEGLPLRVFVMAPSCVPATDMETSGARLTASDITLLFNHERVIGLAEMMNYPGVICRDPSVLKKLDIAGVRPVDGHAPGVTGRNLAAYIAAGIGSDHESTTLEEAREKLSMGMHVMIREGTAERNLDALLPLVTPKNASRCSFCTDDRHPADLLSEGSINSLIARAIHKGLDPVTAVQMATINTARYFGLRRLGAVAPGYHADLVVVEDMRSFNVKQVYAAGKKVAENGRCLIEHKPETVRLRGSVNVAWMALDFKIPAQGDSMRARVIDVVPGQIVTRALSIEMKPVNGEIAADPARDILKLAVAERHMASGNTGVGLVKGFGLKKGAIASSVAHDSHNIIVVGTNDNDMTTAVIEIARMQGGQVVVADNEIVASLSLPIAGLMSDHPMESVRDHINAMNAAAAKLGCVLPDPFMTLSFLALPVIPELKLTDRGLVDVAQFKIVPLLE